MAKATSHKRPFKICNSSRERKKGIACSSLEELKDISRERFMLDPDCRVFLESDGTEVDNEDYFQYLPSQTLFMVTGSNELWVKSVVNIPSLERKFNNESENQESFRGRDEIDGRDGLAGRPTTLSESLKRRILENAIFFLSLSTDELSKIVDDLKPEDLPTILDVSPQRAESILSSCQQELDRRKEIKQAHELLGICQEAISKHNK